MNLILIVLLGSNSGFPNQTQLTLLKSSHLSSSSSSASAALSSSTITCPNVSNPYHSCNSFCVVRFGVSTSATLPPLPTSASTILNLTCSISPKVSGAASKVKLVQGFIFFIPRSSLKQRLSSRWTLSKKMPWFTVLLRLYWVDLVNWNYGALIFILEFFMTNVFSTQVVRAAVLLRVNTLASGMCGFMVFMFCCRLLVKCCAVGVCV